MLGFYPVCPGKPEYVIGTPAFDEIKINTGMNDKPFVIKAPNVKSEDHFIKSVMLNGHPVEGSIVQHDQIINGGEMIFNILKIPRQ